jgi:hypothetical protein
MNYRCPVCFYPSLPLPPEDHNICLCCGTEFGFDDFDSTFDELRDRWVRDQMPWFSREFPAPVDWDPRKQLAMALPAGVK